MHSLWVLVGLIYLGSEVAAMHSPWIPVGLLYLGIFFLWLIGRRQHKGARQYAQRITWVLERLPASEQDRLAALARSGKTVEAVKELRTSTGTDLATAKATVDGLAIFRPST